MMEDAYEIGIRLVLENGVSAGIAALQHDLAAYDRALAAVTGRLHTVSEAERGLKAPVGSLGAGPPTWPSATGEDAEALVVRQARPRDMPMPASAMPALSVPKLPQVSALSTQAPTRPQVASAGPTFRPPQGVPRLPAAPEQPVRIAAEVAQGASPLKGGQALAAVTVMAMPVPRYAQYAPASPAAQPPVVAGQEMPAGSPVSVVAADQRDRPQAPLAVGELFRPPTWNGAPPAAEPVSAGAQAAPRQAGGQAAPAAPAAPAAAAASSGPVQGDVYLDGARVGRWMSDRLARVVDRPQAGVTGFDPRLGPAWPGSLHGT
jgi:hypothetical protein